MNKKPLVLCIMDGWGLTLPSPGNAVELAVTPCYDHLLKTYPNTTLEASGEAVGLPAGQMGNSEVGHMNLGAGRIVYTGLSLINKDIETDQFKNNEHLLTLLQEAKKRGSKLHMMGLLSKGGVHSHFNHAKAFAEICKEHNIPFIFHGFSDGRDVSPDASLTDFANFDKVIKDNNGTWGLISGRYYSMDRDRRWERTNLVYEALVENKCENRYTDVVTYLKESHKNGITDEFIKPALPQDFQDKVIADNDLVFFFNFRPDRARQLTHLLVGSENLYDYKPATTVKNVYLATLMNYEKIKANNVLYPPFSISQTLGEVLAANNKEQLRIAETEKYPHVTFFFDGGYEGSFSGTEKLLIPSPKVATYDLQPEMSAQQITEQLLPKLSQKDVVILNYANPDMVGHTGVISATIKAVETVDHQVYILHQAVKSLGGVCFILADHGNAEVKLDEFNKPATSHTTNPVPFIVTDKNVKLKTGGVLGDIAPTILDYLGIKQPPEMTGKSLLVKK